MTLDEIYKLAVAEGIKADPRGGAEINRLLSQAKKDHKKLSAKEKKYFDNERLTNPYADTRILNGDPKGQIGRVLTGIDLEVPELLLAERLRDRGEKIDLLLAHHPEGAALAALAEVMPMQADIWSKYGVPINVGEFLIDKRMKEVWRSLLPVNHNRAVDAARLLGLSFLTVHTPADNMVTTFLQRLLDRKKPHTLDDVTDILRDVPEYQEAMKMGGGPTILVGGPEKRAGKIMVDMTGGTEGPEGVMEKLATAGVGTLVGMHMGDRLRKQAEKHHVNVIIAGHIASDAVGLNLFLDKLEARGVKITPCSGLIRVKRKARA